MIKNFRNFKINEELDKKTYQSAAFKLKKLKHYDRANRLSNWSLIKDSIKYGKFKVKADVYKTKYEYNNSTYIHLMPLNEKPEDSKLFKKGPVDVYIGFDIAMDFYYDDPEFEAIWITVFGSEEELGFAYDPLFSISIPVEHNKEDGSFMVKDEVHIEQTFTGDHEEKILFDNRVSANNFKKYFLNIEYFKNQTSIYNNLREFFLENSHHEDFEKVFNLISSISVNQLYY